MLGKCKFGTRFYPVFLVPVSTGGDRESAPQFHGFELSGPEAESAARDLARENPGAIAVFFKPEDAFTAGERPVNKTFLYWPETQPVPEPAPELVTAEPSQEMRELSAVAEAI